MKIVLEIKLPISVSVLTAVGDAIIKLHIGKVIFMRTEGQMLQFLYEDISDCIPALTGGH